MFLKSTCLLLSRNGQFLLNGKCAASGVSYCRYFSVKRKIKKVQGDSFSHDESTVDSAKAKFIKLDFNDTSLSQFMLQVKSKKMRRRSNLIYFEGRRLLADALSAGVIPLCVYFSQTEDIKDLKFPKETKLQKMPYNDMKIWSDLTTCPGIFTICRTPSPIENHEAKIPVSVICDNIREPGNLGAIIRNCAAAGTENVFLSEGCTDVWDSKVIRGAMGSHFRIPVHNETSWSDMKNSFDDSTLFIIATNVDLKNPDKNIVPYYSLNYNNFSHVAVIVGGETEGISKDARNIADSFNHKNINIPLCNGVESLNSVSALSVILFEIKRQFDINVLPNISKND